MAKKVSVIIPTKNEEQNIARCLKSVPSATEVLVIDNKSTDKTTEIAKKLGARVFQAGPERSAQRNFGAKKATGEILFFLDADMEVEKEVINQAVDLFEKDTGIKAIIVPEVSVGENYWARVRALERSCYLETEVEAARIFDKEAFFKAGGFDESLVAAEDWDLGQRVQKLGKIGRTKTKIIHHESRLSLTNHLRKKYYYAKNIRLYAQKHPQEFTSKSSLNRVIILAKNWRKLVTDPIRGIGVLILKSLEYLVYLYAKLWPKQTAL